IAATPRGICGEVWNCPKTNPPRRHGGTEEESGRQERELPKPRNEMNSVHGLPHGDPGLTTRFGFLCASVVNSCLIKSEKMANDRKIRVLVAKPGLDGHDRGAKVIARALRDAGMEVIYTGLRQTPEMIVNSALQEDVDVIGLSILSGAHNAIVPRVNELLHKNKMDDVLLLVGGIIPEQDFEIMKKAGVAGIFNPGTPMDEIVEFIRKNV